MTIENTRATDEAEIRALIDQRVKAVRAKDVTTARSTAIPDVLFAALL